MILVHSSQIPAEYLNALSAKLSETIFVPIPPSPSVYKSIASHPDIFIFQIDFKNCITSKAISSKTTAQLEKLKISVIKSDNSLGEKYPLTCAFNAVRIGRFIIHNKKYTDKKILEYAERNSISVINTNQGYSRCSVVPFPDTALMAEDASIFENAKKTGVSSLLINKTNIILPGESQGFIGGTCGLTPKNELVFLGDITKHPDWKKIKQFTGQYNVKIIHLESLPLYDAGSLMFFEV